MIRWLKRLVLTAMMIGLLISNVLTLTSSAFNALLSGAVAGATGIATLSQLNRQTLNSQRTAVTRMGTRMKARAARMATRSTVGSSIKWIPVVGASVAIALTVWELSDLCEGLQDLDQLYRDMEIEDETVPLETCRSTREP